MSENYITGKSSLCVNLLHVSDLHFGIEGKSENEISYEKHKDERNRVISDLISFISNPRRCPENLTPHIFVVSGDIGWKAKESDYDAFKIAFIDKISSIVDKKNIIIVPGNHDIIREEVIKSNMGRPSVGCNNDDVSLESNHPSFPNRIKHYENFANFCKNNSIPPFENKLTKSNNETKEETSNELFGYLYGYRKIEGIHFIALNSAWDCRNDNDKGCLRVGFDLYNEAYTCMSDYDNGVVVAVFHHPYYRDDALVEIDKVHHGDYIWLHKSELAPSTKDEPCFITRLEQEVDIVLNGHVHNPDKEPQHSLNGNNGLYAFTAGALYTKETYRYSCWLIRICCDFENGFCMNATFSAKKLIYKGDDGWYLENSGGLSEVQRPRSRKKNEQILSTLISNKLNKLTTGVKPTLEKEEYKEAAARNSFVKALLAFVQELLAMLSRIYPPNQNIIGDFEQRVNEIANKYYDLSILNLKREE